MKEQKRCQRAAWLSSRVALISSLILAVCVVSVQAQTAPPADAEALQRRMARARALAAAHNLTAATSELDAIRTSTTDDAVRDVARIMLMGIYLEQGEYVRAQNLLEETFKARAPQHEGSCRSYFAVAGQTVNGVRAHLNRYRTFGLNVADSELPAEATNDLGQLRAMLERVAAQAKEIGAGDVKNTDAFALLEDVASVRVGLARGDEDRALWQREVSDARQRLAASETRMASFNGSLASVNPSPALIASTGAVASPRPPSENSPALSNTKNPESAKKETSSAVNTNSQPAPPADGQPLNVGSLIEKAMQKVSPTYPAFAKTARVMGVVRVELVVDEKGSVAAVQSSSGPEQLRQAAIEAAKRWKFRPTVKDGQPVRVAGFISFNFTL